MTTQHGHTAIGELWNSIQTWLFPVLEDFSTCYPSPRNSL